MRRLTLVVLTLLCVSPAHAQESDLKKVVRLMQSSKAARVTNVPKALLDAKSAYEAAQQLPKKSPVRLRAECYYSILQTYRLYGAIRQEREKEKQNQLRKDMFAQLDAANRAGRQLLPGEPDRHEAKILQVTILDLHGRLTVEFAAKTLVEERKHPQRSKEHFELLQERVILLLSLRVASAVVNDPANRGKAEIIGSKMRLALQKLQAELVRRGLPASVASFVLLSSVKYQAGLPFGDAKMIPLLDRMAQSPEVGRLLRMSYLNLRGLMESQRHSYATALRYTQESLALSDAMMKSQVVARPVDHGRNLNNLGLLALRLGDARKARQLLEPAVKMLKTQPSANNDLVNALVNFSKAQEWENQFAQAKKSLEAAIAALGDRPSPFHQALCQNALALNAYGRGDFKTARQQFDIARKSAIRFAGGERHLHVAEVDVNLGWVAMEQGDWQAAAARFSAALKVLRASYGSSHHRVAETLSYLARARAQQKDFTAARKLLSESLQLREKFLQQVLKTLSADRNRLAFVQQLRVHFESPAWPGALDTYLEMAPGLKLGAAEQYARVLAWKGVVDRQAADLGDLESDKHVQALASQRKRLLEQFRQTYFSNVSVDRLAERNQRLNQLETAIGRLDEQLRSSSPRFAASLKVSTVKLAEISTSIPAGSAFLDLFEFRQYRQRKSGEFIKPSSRLVGFLVRPDRQVVRVEFGDSTTVSSAIFDFLDALEEEEVPVEESKALARLIRRPLDPHLKGVQRLVVAKDGIFHRLPFAAIPGRKKKYWAEEISLSLVPSARAITVSRSTRKNVGLLAVGDVAFGDEFDPLKGTKREVETIRRIYLGQKFKGKPVLLLGSAANKSQILKVLQQQRFLHFATHGAFSERQTARNFDVPGLVAQLDSRLVLAEPTGKSKRATQFLTAEEMRQLDLSGVELVVLSACDTGLSFVSSGQTAIGMISALDQAGAKSVLGSLWKVDDQATVEFMSEFYRQLWQLGKSPVECLKAAQEMMIRHKNKKYRHPSYWAAFVISSRRVR